MGHFSEEAPQNRETSLSFQDRQYVFSTVRALIPVQFDELVFSLNAPKGSIPPTASQGEKSRALLEWVESPTGPGLEVVDEYLQSIIPKTSKVSRNLTQAIIRGKKLSELSQSDLDEIVQLVRDKTGDNSIKVLLVTEGCIKIILSGSGKGLEKLQELFDNGEITEMLEGYPLESVHSISNNSSEARKARLAQAIATHSEEYSREALNLSELDLEGINLRNLVLVGADLTGTNLSGALVEGTIFGDNLGLTEADKAKLQKSKAVFQESSDISKKEQLVLSVLGEQEKYGLEIQRAIKQQRTEEEAISLNSLYPILRDLEQKGLIVANFGEHIEERGGLARKYYRLSREINPPSSSNKLQTNAYSSSISNKPSSINFNSGVWVVRHISPIIANLLTLEAAEEWLGDLLEVNNELTKAGVPLWKINAIALLQIAQLCWAAYQVGWSDFINTDWSDRD
jgi:uncharacterized protein YjbI with pentapeptide repeats